MGQNSSNPFQMQLENYEIISVDSKHNTKYLRNKQNNEHFVIRKQIFTDDDSYQNCLKLHQLRQNYNSTCIQKLIRHQTVKTQGICSPLYELYALWQYNPNTLANQINTRKNNNKKFSQRQIWFLLTSCITALLQMDSRQIIHQKLVTQAIKYDQKGNIKVSDTLSLSQNYNFQRVHHDHETNGVYLSPQECNALELNSYCMKSSKSDVWTLGLILLQAGLLEDQNSCYKDQSRRLDFNRVKQNIEKFGAIYGEDLKSILKLMLQFNKKDRIIWQNLKQKVVNMQRIQPMLKVQNQKGPNISRQSPQVISYKSQIQQPQIYSFSKNLYPCPPVVAKNLIPNTNQYPHKQNIQINIQNKIPLQFQPLPMPLQQNKVLINYFVPSQQPPHINYPLKVAPVVNSIPVLLKVDQNRQKANMSASSISNLSNLTSRCVRQMKKFNNLTSSKGYLFEPDVPNKTQQTKNDQKNFLNVQCFVTKQKQRKLTDTHHPNCSRTEKNKFPQIQNTESITYENDPNHILNQKFGQNLTTQPSLTSYPSKQNFQQNKKRFVFQVPSLKQQNKPSLKQPQNQNQVVKKCISIQHIITQLQKQNEQNQDELQYVIEDFKVGSRYQGYKLKNMRHGQGKFYYQDGGMYDGYWEYNKMNGKGSLYYQSGTLAYEGYWKNDQFQGKGKLYNESPDEDFESFDYSNFDNIGQKWLYYEGQFLNDMKQGRGKLMLTNGQYFIGRFKGDTIEGNGKFFGKKGVVKGIWELNHLVKLQ